MLSSLKRFHNVKSFREFFTLLTWKNIDWIAAIPMLLFLTAPLIFFGHITINDGWRFGMTTGSITVYVVVLSIVAMLCGFSKQYIEGQPLRRIADSHRPLLWFLLLALLILLSTAVNGFTPIALHGNNYRCESIFSFWIYTLCYYGGASMIRSERVKNFLINAFLVGSTFTAATGLLDFFGIVPIWHFHLGQEAYTLTAVFFQYNHFAYYLVIAVMLSLGMFLYAKNGILRAVYLLSFAFHTMTLVINKTRGCYLAVVGAVVLTCFVFLKTRKKEFKWLLIALGVFLIATVLGCVLNPVVFSRFLQLFRDAANIADSAAASDPSASTQAVNAAGTGRGSLWRLTIESIARRPVFGWGTEGIADYLKANSLDGNNRPHNEYLQYAAFYGIPAALVYITALCSIYRKAFKQLAELPAINICALLAGVGYLFSACFGNTMFYTAPFLFIMLGLGCYDPLPDKNEQTA